MIDLKVPYWLGGDIIAKLLLIAQLFWNKVETWLKLPLSGHDVDTLDEQRLLLLGWERDVNRFTAEPLELYRKRVKYAYLNAFDAGSVVGFKRIMQRLGVGEIQIEERIQGQDWDIVSVQLNDEQFGNNQELVELIIRYYGRTCRRYKIEITNNFIADVTAATWNDNQMNFEAKI